MRGWKLSRRGYQRLLLICDGVAIYLRDVGKHVWVDHELLYYRVVMIHMA